MYDGLTGAPDWVDALCRELAAHGFRVGDERRFDQPFGTYWVRYVRNLVVVEVFCDRGYPEVDRVWEVRTGLQSEDDDRMAITMPPFRLREILAETPTDGTRPWASSADGAQQASWLLDHLDELESAVSSDEVWAAFSRQSRARFGSAAHDLGWASD